jgi:hypothetical protein
MLDEAEFEILMAKLDAHTNPGEFAKIDTDNSGSIEVSTALVSDHNSDGCSDEVLTDGDGFIKLSEFVAYFETRAFRAPDAPPATPYL